MKKYFLELIVVFVGVYTAFLFDSYKEEKKSLENKIIYFTAFENVLNQYAKKCSHLKKLVDSLIMINTSNEYLNVQLNQKLEFTNTIYIVESVFKSDKFSGIDPQFMVNLEFGANLIKTIEKQIDELKNNIFTAIISNTVNNKDLKQWYLSELNSLSTKIERLMIAIHKGAVPGTKKIISNLRNE
jgi:hypothetical protein